MVKNLSANAEDPRDVDSIPVLGRYSGEENSNLLRYSCLENFLTREVWQANVHGGHKEANTTEHEMK